MRKEEIETGGRFDSVGSEWRWRQLVWRPDEDARVGDGVRGGGLERSGWKMSFLEEDGTNLNYYVDLNEVGHSQLDVADNIVGYNMQYDSNQTYPMSEDSYLVLFSTDNTTTIPSIFSDVPIGPSDAVSTDSVLDDSVELLIEQTGTFFMGKEFVSIVAAHNFIKNMHTSLVLASARTS
ncbi:hypothetical protein LWI29_017185 [Acer saccharum]|uniref:Uncharacterized protein n=1 Tax=Acer saccharum TaxID=4024 RepID=A0AA39VG20_ACESA|nr:hypothetical protein LWI29_017185 [Acer saccharum]